jgi:hypothetical protein
LFIAVFKVSGFILVFIPYKVKGAAGPEPFNLRQAIGVIGKDLFAGSITMPQ